LEHEEEETLKMRDAYNARRLYLIETFKSMGLSCFTPEGAFYVFPQYCGTGFSSDEFVAKLFSEEKLLVIPGDRFWTEEGEGFIRISYAYSLDVLKEAMKRLAHFLKAHPRKCLILFHSSKRFSSRRPLRSFLFGASHERIFERRDYLFLGIHHGLARDARQDVRGDRVYRSSRRPFGRHPFVCKA
jgi:hypothetical protein